MQNPIPRPPPPYKFDTYFCLQYLKYGDLVHFSFFFSLYHFGLGSFLPFSMMELMRALSDEDQSALD